MPDNVLWKQFRLCLIDLFLGFLHLIKPSALKYNIVAMIIEIAFSLDLLYFYCSRCATQLCG